MSVHRIITDPDDLDALLYGEYPEGYVSVRSRHIDTRRWVSVYENILRDTNDGTYWQYVYEVGNTEYQEVDQPESVTLTQVEPYDKTVTAYREIA